MFVSLLGKLSPEMHAIIKLVKKFLAKHGMKVLIIALLGSFIHDVVNGLTSNYFAYTKIKRDHRLIAQIQYSKKRAMLQGQIDALSSRIAYFALAANHSADTLRFFVCKRIFHKPYKGVPCYRYPASKYIKSVLGPTIITQLNARNNAYDENLNTFQDVLSVNQKIFPSLRKPLADFQVWITKTQSNCWFPVNAYKTWERIFNYALEGRSYSKLLHSSAIISEIKEARGGFPLNCMNYNRSAIVKHLGQVNYIYSKAKTFY